ncbi:MAG: tRNA (guanine(10)-N(2))-dimethyltransferase, partial [Methanoregula sp.]|nr:tRNA (guanine(10)-N(2))-dimethyltransferase [Methanoregula sp.]
DPFGTPQPFVDAAIKGTRRFLFVTATDTAPLCGAHLKAGIRRYSAYPMNTEYHSEVGLRILMGFVVRQTARYDRGVEPLFCYAREHFARLHLRLLRGAKAADDTLRQIGYIHQCRKCPYREEEAGIVSSSRVCPGCGEPLQPIGPLWLGELHNRAILADMRARTGTLHAGSEKELIKLLDCCREELPLAGFYDYHVLAKRLVCSPPEISVVISRITAEGYPASRTHFSGYGIKTGAPLPVILNAIRGHPQDR